MEEMARAQRKVEEMERLHEKRLEMKSRTETKARARERDTWDSKFTSEEKKVKKACLQGGGFNVAKYNKMMTLLKDQVRTA